MAELHAAQCGVSVDIFVQNAEACLAALNSLYTDDSGINIIPSDLRASQALMLGHVARGGLPESFTLKADGGAWPSVDALETAKYDPAMGPYEIFKRAQQAPPPPLPSCKLTPVCVCHKQDFRFVVLSFFGLWS